MKIYVHDGQKFHDVPILERVEKILAAAGGSALVDGVAFHWYGKNGPHYAFLNVPLFSLSTLIHPHTCVRLPS